MFDKDYYAGKQSMRDEILCLICGLQNEMGHHKPDDPAYMAYQKLLELIIERYGNMFEKYKG